MINLLAALTGSQLAIAIALGIIGGAIVITLLWGYIVKERANYYNRCLARKKTEIGVDGGDLARTMLDQAGLIDVEVVKCSFWQLFFRANSYSSRKKTIFLTGKVFKKNSIKNIQTIGMLVGLAKLDADGNKCAKRVGKFGIFQVALAVVIPLVAVGIIIDVVTFAAPGVISIVCGVVGFALYLAAFISSIMTVKVVKQANQFAIELIESMAILNEEEFKLIEKSFKLNYKVYVANAIVSALYIVKVALNILWSIIKMTAKRGK